MIIQLDEAKRALNGARPAIEELRNALRIDDLTRQIEELEAKTLVPDFWSRSDSGKILQTIKDEIVEIRLAYSYKKELCRITVFTQSEECVYKTIKLPKSSFDNLTQ